MSRGLRGLALLLAALGCAEAEPPLPVYQAIDVARRDIVVSVEAAGTIQPEVTVEVKSKASGEILEIEAATGQLVEQGALLVRIDQRQPRNTLAQAQADTHHRQPDPFLRA